MGTYGYEFIQAEHFPPRLSHSRTLPPRTLLDDQQRPIQAALSPDTS